MNKQQAAIPVIQQTDLLGAKSCQGCDSEENVTRYRFRTGDRGATLSISWCNRCARTVATFLLKPERSK